MASKDTKTYLIGVLWFCMSLFTSVTNDLISKYTGMRLPSIEVAFFRFLFSTLTLIPFILYFGASSIKSSRAFVHFIRGLLLFLGITAWTYGLSKSPIASATLISFTIPIFTLILALFFLKEQIIWQRWVATIAGFIGIMVVISPQASDFNPYELLFIGSALMFALLDIINKKFVIAGESMISMLFYSALVTTLLALIPALYVWQQPEPFELVLFFILGGGANLILYFILKAFALVEATAVAPYRYLELILSAMFGFVIFNEIPGVNLWYGAIILIPSTLFIVYSESQNIRKKHAETPLEDGRSEEYAR